MKSIKVMSECKLRTPCTIYWLPKPVSSERLDTSGSWTHNLFRVTSHIYPAVSFGGTLSTIQMFGGTSLLAFPLHYIQVMDRRRHDTRQLSVGPCRVGVALCLCDVASDMTLGQTSRTRSSGPVCAVLSRHKLVNKTVRNMTNIYKYRR